MSGISDHLLRGLVIGWVLLVSSWSMAEENQRYERASLCQMMIGRPNKSYNEFIEEAFRAMPPEERFNEHGLGVSVIHFADERMDVESSVRGFLTQSAVGRRLVAKWFSRNKQTGSMNTDLIEDRGYYNLTKLDVQNLLHTVGGVYLAANASENLLNYTFVLVHDFRCTLVYNFLAGNKKNKNQEPTYQDVLYAKDSRLAGVTLTCTSYLYHLSWTDEVANRFYMDYYTEDGVADADKRQRFENDKSLFSLEYVDKVTNTVNCTMGKSVQNQQLVRKTCTRVVDKNIADLQHHYELFRIKAPLVTTEPLSAYVGLKEDITKDSRFEVLERVVNEDYTIEYKRLGIIRPIEEQIWDNRFMAAEEDAVNAGLGATYFETVSGGPFYPGALIREIR